MKKIIFFLILSLSLISCSDSDNKFEYTIVYEVYYNNNTVVRKTHTYHRPYYVGSYQGSNFIKLGTNTGTDIIKTTAPIRVISHTKKLKEK